MGSFYENATANLLSYSQHLELKHTSGAGYWNYEASTYASHTGSGFNFGAEIYKGTISDQSYYFGMVLSVTYAEFLLEK